MAIDTLSTDTGTTTGTTGSTASNVTSQVSEKANQALGAARDALNGRGELVGQAKDFAKKRPFATAALLGVVGVALLNTLRGR